MFRKEHGTYSPRSDVDKQATVEGHCDVTPAGVRCIATTNGRLLPASAAVGLAQQQTAVTIERWLSNPTIFPLSWNGVLNYI